LSRRAVFSKRARRDFIEIQAYIARESGSVAVAEGFVRRLRLKCRNLASLPGMLGRPRDELGTGIRSFAYGNYLILFRYAGDRFEVVNVFEGHRDIDTYFSKDDR